MDELLARIRAALRRASPVAEESALTLGPLTVDLARRKVTVSARVVHLTPTEYDLLRILALNRGRVLTHRQLLREIRGFAYEEETPLLRVHVAALRQKLGILSHASGYIA